jgi:hypothetical protein
MAWPEVASAPRATAPEQGVVKTEWQDGGLVRVRVADPDGYRVELYAHSERHDVEKRRPAPLTR